MVEPNPVITIFFGKFESLYVGSPFMIPGNQIYSALIWKNGLDNIKDVKKVSHGVFHSIPIESIDHRGKVSYNKADWMGWHVADRINLSEKSIKTYEHFFKLRSYQTPFIKDNSTSDRDRLMRHHRIVISSGDKIGSFHADRLSFFIVSNKEYDNLDVGDDISLGAKRNLGFGILRITNKYSFDLDTLDFSEFKDDKKLIETAKSGITGILNHAKYGYGEFKLENWGDRGYLVRLTTPLCLESTIEGSRKYSSPPLFMKSEGYRKHRENIWMKGKAEILYCVSDGGVFFYAN